MALGTYAALAYTRAANAAELAPGVDDHVLGPYPVLQRHASLVETGDYVALLCITVGP